MFEKQVFLCQNTQKQKTPKMGAFCEENQKENLELREVKFSFETFKSMASHSKVGFLAIKY